MAATKCLSRRSLLSLLPLGAITLKQSAAQPANPRTVTILDDFTTGSKGWLAGFSDYSLEGGEYDFLAEVRSLPPEIDSHRKGYFLQGANRSDDLFMFVKKNITAGDGLIPNQNYQLTFYVEIASNAPSGCIGVGGAPGEAVVVKMGGATNEPVSSLVEGTTLRLNLNKGDQSNGGLDAGVAGNIANGAPCEGLPNPAYVVLPKQYQHPTPIRSSPSGSLWVLLGTDSGFEGTTGLYYAFVLIVLRPVP